MNKIIKKSKIVLLIIVILLVCAIVISACIIFKKNNVIKRTFKVDLPDSSEIMEYTFKGLVSDRVVGAKIKIPESELENFLNSFDGYIKYENIEDSPNEENIISWWDLDKNNITSWYMNFTVRHFLWNSYRGEMDIYITKSKENILVYMSYAG